MDNHLPLVSPAKEAVKGLSGEINFDLRQSAIKEAGNDISANQKKLEILDETLSERVFGVSFALGEKLSIARELDFLGVTFVESSICEGESEDDYFQELSKAMETNSSEAVILEDSLDRVRSMKQSANYVALKVSCLYGHPPGFPESPRNDSLSLDAKIREISDFVASFKKLGKQVIFDCEDFFDAFKKDTTYSLNLLESALKGGASRLVLCDSRGTSMPDEIEKATKLVSSHFDSRSDVLIGIHARNDCGLALANTLAAVKAGARHVQGTINGIGERAGNTDLCELLPLAVLKMGYDALATRNQTPKDTRLVSLKSLSEKVATACGFSRAQQPFVSERAFAHTEPAHISEVERNPASYEVFSPELVGNSRKTGVDDASLILSEMWKLGLYAKERELIGRKVLARMRELEAFGYKFDNAKASVHLLILETIGSNIRPFEVTRWETSTLRTLNGPTKVNGTIEVKISEAGDAEEKIISASAKGVGPIHAIDLALRRALGGEFPELKGLKLSSYSLNIVDSLNGTASLARARTEFVDSAENERVEPWATISVSDDVLDASIKALVDGYRYKLIFRNKKERYSIPDWRVALSERYSERW